MKLPSINKPTSAQSANRQLPPRQSNNAISNLEKNLFNKLNEYDDLNKIDTKKAQVNEVKSNKKIDNSHDDIDSLAKRANTLKNYSQTEKIKDLKSSQLKQQKQQQDTVFLTHNQQVKSEESNNDQDEDDSNSDSSIEDLLQRSRALDKQKKVMLNFEDDSEVGQLNKMLFQTDIDLDEQFQSMCILKKTISQMQDSMKSLGYGINEKLMDGLNQQYEEMIKLQRESQAIEEYQMKESNSKNKMPALRSNSVNQSKKLKK
ncbi:unnamed protein product (macronuclear) [Paramecium tetraurelia]|uniref:t-SNARE coiled-coil homology domain-containing protein n=1 Tax=Paramecium tetraurelia TaxID=5888 RepID=A0DQ56_PARTE|nr:uncharacterized protein GSPATT00002573001 [Paramecium tetraurelia]CAK85173.1 unnamed protein product [Paramecium tetraurelia]|eukprot:XP_001452570.1 hypothetical protein (macronuclear) [Paramecium tetraurelia strain d4-2]